MEDDSAFAYKEKKPAGSIIGKILFSHVGLLFLVLLYTFLGALAFIELEKTAELSRYSKKMNKARSVNQSMNYLVQRLWFYESNKSFTIEDYTPHVMGDLENLESVIMDAIGGFKYDGTVDGWVWDWTFSQSSLFTMSIITTIGYGNIYPKTFYGQMFCIVYALVGCPLLLLFLSNIGEVMAESLTYFYSRCCCRWCRSRRYVSELPPGVPEKHAKEVYDDVVGQEEYMPTKKVTVPITINLVLLAAYIMLGALMFQSFESWKFHSSCYFTFITVATVGYGDYYPKASMVNDLGASFVATAKMMISILYLLAGMALLSMAVNLMQEQIVEKCRWLAREIGLSGDSNAPKDPNAKKDPKALKDSNDSKDPNAAKDVEAGNASKGPGNYDRRESVAGLSVPESPGLTPSAAPTRPSSALSMLPGTAE